MSENSFQYIGEVLEFDASKPQAVVQLLKYGKYRHPKAKNGILDVDEKYVDELVTNFQSGIACPGDKPELPTNENHDDPKFRRSPAWLKNLHKRDNGLFAEVNFSNEDFLKSAKNGEVKYISSELVFDYFNNSDGKRYNVIRGAGWTNIPAIKGMKGVEFINLSEICENDKDFALLLASSGVVDADPRGPSQDDLNPGQMEEGEGDPDAQDPHLPTQCSSCNLLADGSCPFRGIEVKMAAAGEGNCPQYVSDQAEMNSGPGMQSNATQTEAQMSEATSTPELEGTTEIVGLNELNQQVVRLSELVGKLSENNDELRAQLEQTNTQLSLSEFQKERTIFETKTQELYKDGKITSHQLNLAMAAFDIDHNKEVLCNEINLSESEEPASMLMVLSAILEANETQVKLDENDLRRRTDTVGEREKNVNLSAKSPLDRLLPKIEERAKELAKQEGKPWRSLMGIAAREVTREEREVNV